jgi:hypothetical protein
MKKSLKSEDLELSLTAYARFRSHSVGWVSTQIAEGTPHTGGGVSGKRVSIPVARAVAWEISRAQASAQEPVQTERARLQREQADRIALQNAEHRGELVPIAAMVALIRDAGSKLRADLDGFAGRMAGAVAGMTDVVQIRALLFKECRRLQQEFADSFHAKAAETQPRK